MSGSMLVKTFGRQDHETARFATSNDTLRDLSVKRQMTGRWFNMGTTMYSMIIDGKSHDVRMNEGDGVYVFAAAAPGGGYLLPRRPVVCRDVEPVAGSPCDAHGAVYEVVSFEPPGQVGSPLRLRRKGRQQKSQDE